MASAARRVPCALCGEIDQEATSELLPSAGGSAWAKSEKSEWCCRVCSSLVRASHLAAELFAGAADVTSAERALSSEKRAS
jgi:hypothetical protein